MSMPRVGIDGCGTALQAMGVEFKANNALDLEHRYGRYLEEHLQQRNIYVGFSLTPLTVNKMVCLYFYHPGGAP